MTQYTILKLHEVSANNINKKNIINQKYDDWLLVNDTIMGGLSQSKFEWNEKDNSIQFSGDLILKNNAGFVSASKVIAHRTFDDNNQFCIKVKGDGRKYQFRVRTQKAPQKQAYSVEFQTIKDQWQTLFFSTEEFVAKHRGLRQLDAPALVNSQIEQIAFLLADKKSGYFKLDIASISAC